MSIETLHKSMKLTITEGMKRLFETVHFSRIILVFRTVDQFIVLVLVSAVLNLLTLLWLERVQLLVVLAYGLCVV